MIMNSIENATLHSGIGVLRRIFHKLPSWYNQSSSSKLFNFNYCDERRNFHKRIKHCDIDKSKGDVLDELVIKPFSRRIIKQGPGLKNFMPSAVPKHRKADEVPYFKSTHGHNRKVYIDIYGCQMNVNDAEVILSILKSSGYKITKELDDADVILVLTCAIREGAEQKIWIRLRYFRHLINKKKAIGISKYAKIGILGCMAERLKEKVIEKDRLVDLVAGPDSYKDLPRLLALTEDDESAINVILSFDETYAEVTPVRLNPESVTAYVTIMRGCDNMCTFCIVPFTRGRERSRPINSIEDEIRRLSDQGVKEVTLLGQNVNSYRDDSMNNFANGCKTNLAKGFETVYKNKKGGLRFCDLLDKVSIINPNMRIRFTSAHPKDFPDEVLHLIAERPNICKQLHLPAQSGNSAVLKRMRRGYTREAYLELVQQVRSIIPNVHLSSDFIAGFSGETDGEFEETLSLIQMVKYNQAFLFAYSMREKTLAHRRFKDDVTDRIKKNRLLKMIEMYRKELKKLNAAQVGQQQLILIEGPSKKDPQQLVGRNDGCTKVIISNSTVQENKKTSNSRQAVAGDYVVVQISDSTSQTLKGVPLYLSSITEFTHSPKQKFRSYCE